MENYIRHKNKIWLIFTMSFDDFVHEKPKGRQNSIYYTFYNVQTAMGSVTLAVVNFQKQKCAVNWLVYEWLVLFCIHTQTHQKREREKEESKWDAHMWMPLRTFDTAQTKQFNERSIRICVKWWVAVITIIGISSSRISSTVFSNLWNSFVA